MVDPVVLKYLEKGLKDTGVRIWKELVLKDWVVSKEEGEVVSLLFQSQHREGREVNEYEVPCQAMVYIDEKHVDMQAFKGTCHGNGLSCK